MPIRDPRVFTIPPGAPFLPTLARALIDGELIPGFPGAGGPLALASATIYVPTQRAAAALAEALLAASGGESVLLPRIAPLGAFEPDDATKFFEPAGEQAPRAKLPPAVGELMRRHTLAVLVRAWGQALRGAIRGADADGLVFDRGEPALVASTPAQAYALAGDLAALIDDMIIEGVDWRRIETLAPDAYDSYWRITLDFLKIAFTHWPQWLAENGLLDRAKRVALSVDAEITRLEAGAIGPTIIAGSTGANRATAELIAAIARSEKGAVVLPGLDKNLDEPAWAMIGSGEASAQGLAGHPQALAQPADRAHRRRARGCADARRAVFSARGARGVLERSAAPRRVRPKAGASGMRRWRRRPSPPPSTGSRSSSRTPTRRRRSRSPSPCAKSWRRRARRRRSITPDPSIARRVAAELARWGVEVENSAGRTLGESEAGALARLVLKAAIEPSPLNAQALLAHPAARLGRALKQRDDAARALELAIFRAAPIPALADLDKAFADARMAAADGHAHPAVRAIGEKARGAAEKLARDLAAILEPMQAARTSLRERLQAHRAALAALMAAPGGEEAAAHGLDALEEMMDEWSEAAGEGFPCTLAEYAALFDEALAGVRAPPAEGGHPRLKMLGLLEARLLSFDRALIAGLDEKVWPPAVETDAFLNRPMRAELGLSAPERRVGQTAHDFVAALGAREAISAGRGSAPASRPSPRAFCSGSARRAAQRRSRRPGRGDAYLRYARALDKPDKVSPIGRPAPTPPVELRPRALSVTRIETLRRDPYALYAERILEAPGRWSRSNASSGPAKWARPGTARCRNSRKLTPRARCRPTRARPWSASPDNALRRCWRARPSRA